MQKSYRYFKILSNLYEIFGLLNKIETRNIISVNLVLKIIKLTFIGLEIINV